MFRKQRRWKLENLYGLHDFVNTAAEFLTNLEPAHQPCQTFITRPGLLVHEPFRRNKRSTWAGYFYTVIENLNYGSRPGNV